MIENYSYLKNSIIRKGLARQAFGEGLAKAFPRLEIGGVEYLEEAAETLGSGLEIVANHLSNADGPVIKRAIQEAGYKDMARDLHFIVGTVLTSNPLTSFLVRGYKGVIIPSFRTHSLGEEPLKREKMKMDGMKAAKVVLSCGMPLGMFAEATRSRTRKMNRGKAGVAEFIRLAQDGGILPVSVEGTDNVLPIGSFIPSFGLVRVNFGKLLMVRDLEYRTRRYTDRAKDQVMIDLIMLEIAKSLSEKYRGVYALSESLATSLNSL